MIRATVVFSLLWLALSSPAPAAIIDLTAQTSGIIDLTYGAGTLRVATAQQGGQFIVTPGSTGQATGSGTFHSFVRIDRKGNEHGYNTSNRPVRFDEKTNDGTPQGTRALLLSEIPLVTIDGVDYRVFNLDVAETAAWKQVPKNLLSINQIQIFRGYQNDPLTYTSLTPDLPATDKNGKQLAYVPSNPPVISFADQGLQEIFRLNNSDNDAGASGVQFNQIKLDYNLIGSGNGRNDMSFLVRNSLFGQTGLDLNVVLYSHFGSPPGDYYSEGSYEEWAVDDEGGGINPEPAPNPNPVPEPTTLVLWGGGLFSAVFLGRARTNPTQMG